MELWEIAAWVGLHREATTDEEYAAKVTAEQGEAVRKAQAAKLKAKQQSVRIDQVV